MFRVEAFRLFGALKEAGWASDRAKKAAPGLGAAQERRGLCYSLPKTLFNWRLTR